MYMKPEDLLSGQSYACKFRIKTYLDDHGAPLDLTLLPAEPGKVKTGDWVSWGVIAKRDTENRLLEVEDQQVQRIWILNWDEVWDIDTAAYPEDDQDD